MKRLVKNILVWGVTVLLALCWAMPVLAAAQPDETEPPAEIHVAGQEAAEEVPQTVEEDAAAEAEPEPEGETGIIGDIHEQTFSQEHTMEGMFTTFSEYFYAGNWEIHKATLSIVYSTTPLVLQDVSDFTVALNGQPIFSMRVEPTQGTRRTIEIDLPAELIIEGVNTIMGTAYIRTNEDDPCTDDSAKMGWMVLDTASQVSVNYTSLATCTTISEFYTGFSSVEALGNNKSGVWIPEGASETELTVAGLALSGMAANASMFYDNVLLGNIEKYQDRPAAYTLYIAEYERLLPDIKSQFSGAQEEAAKQGAALVLLSAPEGGNMLVLTGSSRGALLNAGRLLGNKSYVEQFQYNWRAVAEGEEVIFRHEDNGTLPLTEEGSYLYGVFRRSQTFYINNYPDRVVAAGSEVQLAFRYSENLDFDRSLVTVYIDGTPVGSKKLTRDAANEDLLTVPIPNDMNIRGSFSVEIAFDLEMLDQWCTQRAEDMPWAYISSDSILDMEWEKTDKLLFEYYPGPFLSDGHMNAATFVLPDAPTEEEYEALRLLVTTMGRSLLDNSGTMRVCHAAEAGDLSAQNVVLIGTPGNNPLILAQNNNMLFNFTEDAQSLASNEKIKIDPAYGRQLGVAQLLYSPYSDAQTYALLVVSGVEKEGVVYAAQSLGSEAGVSGLEGDALLAGGRGVQVFRFKEDNELKLSPFAQLTQQTELLMLVFIGGGVLVLIMISAVLLFVKYRKKGKENG